ALAVGRSASGSGFSSVTRQVSVPARRSAHADFSLTPDARSDDEPHGLLEAPRDRESLTVRSSELTALPGLAPFDVFRAIDLLPASSLTDTSAHALNGHPPGASRATVDVSP